MAFFAHSDSCNAKRYQLARLVMKSLPLCINSRPSQILWIMGRRLAPGLTHLRHLRELLMRILAAGSRGCHGAVFVPLLCGAGKEVSGP
jgi:hypothetical protein